MSSGGAPVVGGIVLAAGGGTRFGATKQLAPLRGRPLLSYAVESILSVRLRANVVAITNGVDEIAQQFIDGGFARFVAEPRNQPSEFQETGARRWPERGSEIWTG